MAEYAWRSGVLSGAELSGVLSGALSGGLSGACGALSGMERSAVECSGVGWGGVEWGRVEWSGVEWRGGLSGVQFSSRSISMAKFSCVVGGAFGEHGLMLRMGRGLA